MQTLIFETQDTKEMELVKAILTKMNLRFSISDKKMEDLIFGEMINEGRKTKLVSKDSVMKALRR
jgi:hypothetical protein